MNRRQVQQRLELKPRALQLRTSHVPSEDSSNGRLVELVANLVERMSDPALHGTSIIPWSCPVPSFGNLSSSLVATLGLNPSNREFVDEVGEELDGDNRRFHTLKSLKIRRWSDAKGKHFEQIADSCRGYFSVNPYDGWFRKLDRIIAGTNASYYDGPIGACHLDLIPYATACKWTELSPKQRTTLLDRMGDTLGLLLKESRVRVLVLNGRSVVDHFEAIADVRLARRTVSTWSLPRRSEADVKGLAYQGVVDSVAGIALGRQVVVLGFNHNVQSSFGVTNQVMNEISGWVTRSARSLLR